MRKPLTLSEVESAQKAWGDAIVAISASHKASEDFVSLAGRYAGEMYGYGHFDKVLFKPTKASSDPFRPSASSAMSYFVGGDNLEPKGFDEDKGFAINGGKGWSKVEWKNHDVILNRDTAIAMGEVSTWRVGMML